jgi:TonB family protein
VDTTLNDDTSETNLEAAAANLDQNLPTDLNQTTDEGYYPETASPSAGSEDDETNPATDESDEQPMNEDPSPATPQGSLAGLFSNDDYPSSALNNGEQGAVTASLQIDRSGRVSGCSVVRSSGSTSLDSATCRILSVRARFRPARDERGVPVGDQTATTINWHIQ